MMMILMMVRLRVTDMFVSVTVAVTVAVSMSITVAIVPHVFDLQWLIMVVGKHGNKYCGQHNRCNQHCKGFHF